MPPPPTLRSSRYGAWGPRLGPTLHSPQLLGLGGKGQGLSLQHSRPRGPRALGLLRDGSQGGRVQAARSPGTEGWWSGNWGQP